MKKHIFIFSAIALMTACQPKEADKSELSKLITERDSLSDLVNKSQSRINELAQKISEIDTTQKITNVSALSIDLAPFKHYIEVYGTVESDLNATLTAEMGGTIVIILVKEGQQVSKGQLLVQLDASILLSSLKEIKTQYSLANTLFEKQERLWKQKVGSEVQYLQAKSTKESLEGSIKTLESQVSKMSIRAPFSGVVDEIFTIVGQLAGPQSPLIRIINLDEVHVSGDIPESYLGKITKGSSAVVEFTTLGKTIETQVNQTGNFINPANRTFKIRLNIDNKTQMIKPNAMANIKIIDYQIDSAIVLPNRVIQRDNVGNSFIYTVEPTTNDFFIVKKQPIQIGRSYQSSTEVLSGLKPGVQVVDKGSRSIKDLQKVKIINDTEA